jgi:hypothetical protein
MKRARSTFRIALLVLAAVVSLAAIDGKQTEAAAIYIKDQAQPICGFIKSETATHITIVTQENGAQVEKMLAIANIERVLKTIDAKRLEQLEPSKIEGYRDYAEELMVMRQDPEAMEMAIRLLTITAYLDQGSLRKSALRALVRLARSEDEKRRFSAIAFQYQAISSPLRALASENETWKPVPNALREEFAEVILHVRKGQAARAKQLARSPSLIAAFETYALAMTHTEFAALVEKSSLDNHDLAELISLELRMIDPEILATIHQSEQSWGSLTVSGQLDPVKPLEIRTMTEFDPAACYFAGGKWTDRR